MKRVIKILVGVLFAFSLGIGVGHLLSVPGPASGVGQGKQSPDEKWDADAFTMDDGSLFGPHRTYSQFTIRTHPPDPRIVRTMTIEDTTVPPIDWREEGSIVWATNSSAVTFKCDARQTRLEVTLKIEP